jgi:hypothetical protein
MGIPIAQIGATAGRGFFWYLKMCMTLLLFIYIFIVAILLSIQAHDPSVFVQEIGKQLFSPMQTAQELIKNFDTETIGSSIISYFSLIFELYKIFVWLKIFMWISNKLSIDSALIRLLVSLVIFYLLQCIYTTLMFRDIALPFVATKDIIIGVFNIIMSHKFSTDIGSIKETVTDVLIPSTNNSNNQCLEGICVV